MKLVRLGDPGRERPAVIDDRGVTRDLSSLTSDIDGAFLAADGIARTRRALADDALPPLRTEGLRFGPPVARPGAVVCIGQNYAAHAAESGSEPPTRPVIFFKPPNTVVGPNDEVEIPRGSARTDWEVELAVVIGRTARYLDSPGQALEHVAGYAVSNDVSERDFQLEHSGGQWSKGKSCATFNPLGPFLVPADEVPDVQALRLRSFVNGEPRQDSRTADMIFSVAQLVYDLSQYLVLDPGDVINTGTPEGVALSGRFPYLRPGDVMEIEIEGLGRQRQALVPAQTSSQSSLV
ncbi:fumarylacetoacetate hydrolase family protein [Streptomyces anthocyanicus]|uniref:fumarylacetoacetate hydrolase family protein n=1 Tax=Streptomyces anthocyanicus TaxID=68174 RepID=UPI003625B5B9